MYYSDKNELLPNTENPYYRKTPVSRSIKQNGEYLFSKQRRRVPITHYVPPHRRKDSMDDGSLPSNRSEIKDRTPVRASDQRNALQYTEDTFYQAFDEKSVIAQEINGKSIVMEEINRSRVITQETNKDCFTQQLNKERMKQSFNQDYVNQESFTEEFSRESLRPISANTENINHVSNQEGFRKKIDREKSTQEYNQNPKRRPSRENLSHKVNRLSTVEKLLKLSQQYMNTVYKQILCDLYYDEYKEKLPTKCLNAIKFCIQLDLDDSINEFLDAESCNEQNQERRDLMNEDHRLEKSLLCQKEILSKPKELDLKTVGEEFWVFIYNCDTFINIWGVIMDADHLGKVEELADQLKNFFQFENKGQTIKVEENSYYALFDGSWHRVQCIKCNESTAEVFFIDRGDKDNVSIDRLLRLDPKFFELPAQAINMSLSDLEVFTSCDGNHKILDELLFEKSVYVIVKVLNEEKNPCLSVQLYIKKDDETVNVNELLLKKLFETVLNPLHYIQEDNPEHIEFIQTNEAVLFIQLHTVSLNYFKLLMEDLIEKHCCDGNLEKQKVVRFEGNKIYLVKRSRGNKFYRARVLKFKTETMIEVLLIDNGIVTFIKREDFFALEKLSLVLVEYPAQAIEVQLDQITVLHPKILDHIHNLTSNSKELYVKFLKKELENNNTPIIRLFKKVNGYLISVNDAILIEHNDILESQSNIFESKLKTSEYNFGESKLKSVEDFTLNVDQSKLKSTESHFGESTPKLAERNFGDIKRRSAENSFAENKPKLAEENLVESKRKSAENSFAESKLRSAAGNLIENQAKSMEDDFYENRQKSVDDNFNKNKSKLVENNFAIIQKSDEEWAGELLEKNFLSDLERIKIYEAELTRPVEEVDCTNLCISGLLNPPEVPEGRYFDVHILIAKDPSCFAFQLLKSKSVELKKMIDEMRIAYADYKGPKLTYRSLGVGQMYACRCELNSEMWYRVYLLKIKDKDTATVYYCDYGWYKDVNIENLICLQREFYSLPYQIFWAELYGVKPVSGQFWTTEVCSRFKELVESKNFVCHVKAIKNVKAINRCKSVPLTLEYIYVVKLIDTSTDEDLFIADILINDGQASKQSSNRHKSSI